MKEFTEEEVKQAKEAIVCIDSVVIRGVMQRYFQLYLKASKNGLLQKEQPK
jgi:hypothetical protein